MATDNIMHSVGEKNGVRGRNDPDDVMAVQGLLKSYGFYQTDITPFCSARTISAIKDFQKTMNMTPDGLVEPFRKTWIELARERVTLNPGVPVLLPNGTTVPDNSKSSPTGMLMSPVQDLRPVAEAGRALKMSVVRTGQGLFRDGDISKSANDVYKEAKHIYHEFRTKLGHGGQFDYQRKKHGRGFIQRRQFRNVSNFNVGLFGQQAGWSLTALLIVSGQYARSHGSMSSDLSAPPYFLNSLTQLWTEIGYGTGESGVFGK